MTFTSSNAPSIHPNLRVGKEKIQMRSGSFRIWRRISLRSVRCRMSTYRTPLRNLCKSWLHVYFNGTCLCRPTLVHRYSTRRYCTRPSYESFSFASKIGNQKGVSRTVSYWCVYSNVYEHCCIFCDVTSVIQRSLLASRNWVNMR